MYTTRNWIIRIAISSVYGVEIMPMVLLCCNMDSKLRRVNSAQDDGQSAAFECAVVTLDRYGNG